MIELRSLQAAVLRWQEGLPFSTAFNDVYFSRDGAIEESRYVFLQGNDLPERWHRHPSMVIGELGFGTGLNFLLTLSQWLQSAPASANLHYLAFEKHPLDVHDLKKALALWPQFESWSTALVEAYPVLLSGVHQRSFCQGRVRLTLVLGDVRQCLPDLQARVNAWYLDGFAPSANPQMWSAEVFQQLRRLSAASASFATYSASGLVRRGLEAVGFSVKKLPGFGRKREMLTGVLTVAQRGGQAQEPPWFALPYEQLVHTRHQAEAAKAVVVGAGLAGIATAHALVQRGWRVTLLERHQQVAQEASGNLSGVVLPRLTVDMNVQANFYLHCFLYTVARLRQLSAALDGFHWHETGVLQLWPRQKQQALAQLQLPADILLLCDWAQAQALCGQTLCRDQDRLPVYFPQAGWLGPRQFCRSLLDDCHGVELKTGHELSRLDYDGEQWSLWGDKKLLARSPVVILTNAYDSGRLLPYVQKNLQQLRGQLSYVRAAPLPGLRTPVCYDGYIVPENQGMYCVGASYERCNGDKAAVAQVREQDHQTVLQALSCTLPAFAGVEPFGGRCAFRTSSRDHLPLVGPVIDEDHYLRHYHNLHHGKPAAGYMQGKYLPGLFINSAHGSRGLVSALPAAELVACLLNGEPLPLPASVLPALHSARFLIRDLKHAKA